MTVFVLDNSVTMRWCFENSTHPYADTVLQTLAAGQAIVPVLWRYEVSAVLAKAQKDGTIAPQRKLANEKPKGETIDYDTLIKSWPATPPKRASLQ